MSDSTILLIGSIAAILQTILLILSIFFINKQFGIVRACSYIERFNTNEHIRRRVVVDQWLMSSDDNQVRIREFEKKAELQAEILGFMNLFQELGVAFSNHNVNKETVRETFDFLAPYYWEKLRFLIEHLRQKRSKKLYLKFEHIAKSIAF